MGLILGCIVVLVCAASVIAQDKPETLGHENPAAIVPGGGIIKSGTRQVGTAAPTAVAARPDTPVITLNGVCDRPQQGDSGCKTVITRAEIESLINVLEPNASPLARRQFTINYARLVAAFGAAQRRHLEKDPAVASALQMEQKIVRMQVMADVLYRQIEANANDVPSADIENYYAGHQAGFEQCEVWRLSIPRSNLAAGGPSPDESVLKAKAQELRARAAAGEDFEQLQQEAYKALGIKAATPPTKLKLVRRPSLSSQDSVVFDLDPGQVTQVLDSQGGFVVLKLESKQPLPLDSVRAEITTLLRRERTRQEIRNVTQSSSAEFNLEYLGLPSAPELFPPPGLAQLSPQQGAQPPQRMPLRRPMMPRKRAVTVVPNGQR